MYYLLNPNGNLNDFQFTFSTSLIVNRCLLFVSQFGASSSLTCWVWTWLPRCLQLVESLSMNQQMLVRNYKLSWCIQEEVIDTVLSSIIHEINERYSEQISKILHNISLPCLLQSVVGQFLNNLKCTVYSGMIRTKKSSQQHWPGNLTIYIIIAWIHKIKFINCIVYLLCCIS